MGSSTTSLRSKSGSAQDKHGKSIGIMLRKRKCPASSSSLLTESSPVNLPVLWPPIPHPQVDMSTSYVDLVKLQEDEQGRAMLEHLLTKKGLAFDQSYIHSLVRLMPHNRAILVDWMFELSNIYRLQMVTVHLAVNFFDRVIERDVNRTLLSKLQLLGIACLWIACKFEENDVLPGKELAIICSDPDSTYQYTVEDVYKMERHLLDMLQFQLNVPTIYSIMEWCLPLLFPTISIFRTAPRAFATPVTSPSLPVQSIHPLRADLLFQHLCRYVCAFTLFVPDICIVYRPIVMALSCIELGIELYYRSFLANPEEVKDVIHLPKVYWDGLGFAPAFFDTALPQVAVVTASLREMVLTYRWASGVRTVYAQAQNLHVSKIIFTTPPSESQSGAVVTPGRTQR